MKKAINKTGEPGMRPEYDFSRGVRGKYARRFAQGTNVVKGFRISAARFAAAVGAGGGRTD